MPRTRNTFQAVEGGYRVALAARSKDKLDALVAELGGSRRAIAIECDVTDWDQQRRMVQTTLDHFGQLDVVFANLYFTALAAGSSGIRCITGWPSSSTTGSPLSSTASTSPSSSNTYWISFCSISPRIGR